MLEMMLCSLLTVFPDYLFRRYVQGKRIGKEITLYSVWFELRWGITGCLILTVLLITTVFYNHPSTTNVTFSSKRSRSFRKRTGASPRSMSATAGRSPRGRPIFRLDSSKQEAAVETAQRKIAEVDADMVVAKPTCRGAEGQIQEAKSAYQQTVDELETKQELKRRNPATSRSATSSGSQVQRQRAAGVGRRRHGGKGVRGSARSHSAPAGKGQRRSRAGPGRGGLGKDRRSRRRRAAGSSSSCCGWAISSIR